MDIVISFDDTGSMSSVRAQVRQKIKELVDKLFSLNEKMRIGVIIHNDYCDKDTIQHMDLTDNKKDIIDFVNRGSSCGGGDSDECYELAINYIHDKFSWSDDSKIGIIIGDCNPHPVGYKHGKWHNLLDWKDEVKKCVSKGIKLYAVQALGDSYTRAFYTGIGAMSNTPRLDLSQFAHILQFITAITYSEEGKLAEYESTDESFKTNTSLKRMFDRLKGLKVEDEPVEDWESAYSSRRSYGRKPVDIKDYGTGDGTKTIDIESRFQVLEVGPAPKVIRKFVEDNGATFKAGRGFYQFILTETIQEKKEVLMVDKKTGEVKADTIWCRNQLGIPLGTRGRLNPKNLEASKNYDIFIQSTSYNRKLDPNTKFLYELEHK